MPEWRNPHLELTAGHTRGLASPSSPPLDAPSEIRRYDVKTVFILEAYAKWSRLVARVKDNWM